VNAPLLQVRGLTVEYRSGPDRVRPLSGFDLDAESGELVLVLGPSGCGKTSLLSSLAGILTPASGTITFDGRNIDLAGPGSIEYRRLTVGVVFQAFNLVPSLSALENVAVPLLLAGVRRGDAKAKARSLLEQVNLGDRLRAKPAHLSGGQQQRVAIARALTLDPPLLLADEPTAHLDAVQVEGVLRILRDLASPGRVVIVSTHDTRLVPLADRVIEMAPKVKQPDGGVRTVLLRPGETLFAQGDPGDLVYVVESGAVEIVREEADGARTVLNVITAGDYFGELAPLLGFPRSASARARTKTTVTGYPVQQFKKSLAPGAAVPNWARSSVTRKSGSPATRRRSSPARSR
jgi:putative ABC transport system ATP-binding protein